jgi:hypothetical protein
MDLSETFNENKEKLAALAALAAMAGTAIAAKKVPVAGVESVLSFLSKKGKLVRKLADNDSIETIRKSYNARRPSIFDSTKITNDDIRFLPNLDKRMSQSSRDALTSKRRGIRQDYKQAKKLNDQKGISALIKEAKRLDGYEEFAGDNAPAAALSRLNRGLSGDTVGLTRNNRTTSDTLYNLNDPQVLEKAMSELSLSSRDAYDVITRANLLKKQRSIEAALNEVSGPDAGVVKKIMNKNTARKKFKEEFRQAVAIRPEVIDRLDTAAIKLSEKTGDSIEVAKDKLRQAFSELSPQKTASNNMDDLEDQIQNVLDGVVQTTEGQKQRALDILLGNTTIYDDRLALDNSKKVINLYEGLAKKSSVPVLDTDVLRNILPYLQGKEFDSVSGRLYDSPYVYKNLTNEINDLISKGQVSKVSRNLVGKELAKRITGSKRKKINNFFLQGGIDMREGF